MTKWAEGHRVYYVMNGRVHNSFVNRVRDDGVVTMKDGRCRFIDEVFKTKQQAVEWLFEDKEEGDGEYKEL